MRSYYSSLRRHRRTWKPLFNFLLHTITTNCYKLSSFTTPGWPHKAGHKAFLQKLIYKLFEQSSRVPKSSSKRVSTNNIVWQPLEFHGYKPEKINDKLVTCSACLEAGRKASQRLSRRKPLVELSASSVRRNSGNSNSRQRRQRAPKTRFGCRLCRIPLCERGPCWKSHIDQLTTLN
jgi:hypothetical protein